MKFARKPIGNCNCRFPFRENIADTYNHRVRVVDARTGIITTAAGNTPLGAEGGYSGDGGPAAAATLNLPVAIALDGAGNLLIADAGNNRIRRVDRATRIITTVAGGAKPADGIGDGGRATDAALNFPRALAVDRTGNLFISDVLNQRVRRVDVSTGSIATVAGGGSQRAADILATQALLYPGGIALDADGNLFVADDGSRIFRVSRLTGFLSTVAGNGTYAVFSGDNGPATAAGINGTRGITVDASGNLIIADSGNNRIRAVRGPIP